MPKRDTATTSMSDDLEARLGTECPACGDTYHDLPRHLALNYKGCATTTPVQFTCEHCGHHVPWLDAGLTRYEHRNQCPHCMYSKHIMFGTTTLKPCDGLMRPAGITNTAPPFLITECETCGFCWVTYHEDHWATLQPHQQTALINQAYEQTETRNHAPTIIYRPSPGYCTPPPPIPPAQLKTRKRAERRP